MMQLAPMYNDSIRGDPTAASMDLRAISTDSVATAPPVGSSIPSSIKDEKIDEKMDEKSNSQLQQTAFKHSLELSTAVAGVRHYAKNLTLPIPIDTSLLYAREASNPRDPNAIRLFLHPIVVQPSIKQEADANATATATPAESDTIMTDTSNSVTAASSSAVVSDALDSDTPVLHSPQPIFGPSLGHLPAILARRLTPLLTHGLITLRIIVSSPPPPVTEDSDDGSTDTPIHESATNSHLSSTHSSKKEAISQYRVEITVHIDPVSEEKRPHPITTAQCSLWRDLELYIELNESSSRLSYDERILTNFTLIIETVIGCFPHLFLGDEIQYLRAFLALPTISQRLYIRLFGRVRPERWFQVASLKYPWNVEHAIHGLVNESQSAQCMKLEQEKENERPTHKQSHQTAMDQRSITCPSKLDCTPPAFSTFPSSTALPTAASSSSSPPPFSFVARVSSLSISEWSLVLPSIIHDCSTHAILKDLLQGLGLKNKISLTSASANGGLSAMKDTLIAHLTRQRTFFASSMLACPKTRATIMSVCGDVICLSPPFLTLCKRIHRLFFLREDPDANALPMKLEEIGLWRWWKSEKLMKRFKEARGTEKQEEHSTTSAVGLVKLEPGSSTAPSSFTPAHWRLFPTRACFIAYDHAFRYVQHMQQVCESALYPSSEARKAYGVYTTDQALALLAEAKRRMEMEVERADSTADLDEVPFESMKFGTSSPSSPFKRARSLPLVAASNVSSPPPTTVVVTAQASSASFLTSITYEIFQPYHTAASAPGSSSASSPSFLLPDPFDSSHPHSFIHSYRASTIYAHCMTYGIRVLERLKRYTEANSLFYYLLSQPYAPHRRGEWWNRLALNMETHEKSSAHALEMVKKALTDPYVQCGELFELKARFRRLWKRMEGDSKPSKSASASSSASSRMLCPIPPLPDYGRPRALESIRSHSDFDTNTDDSYIARMSDGVILSVIVGSPTNCITGIHSRFYTTANEACRVENMTLEYFARESYGSYQGVHDEGRVIYALFTLLMWDVMFLDLPYVWQTSYQDAPLDLSTPAFYTSRREQIDALLNDIQSCNDISSRLSTSWLSHHGIRVRGLNWRNEDLSLSQLQEIGECLGGFALSKIFSLIAHNYGGWSGGMPDLCLWRPTSIATVGASVVPAKAEVMEDVKVKAEDQLASVETKSATQQSVQVPDEPMQLESVGEMKENLIKQEVEVRRTDEHVEAKESVKEEPKESKMDLVASSTSPTSLCSSSHTPAAPPFPPLSASPSLSSVICLSSGSESDRDDDAVSTRTPVKKCPSSSSASHIKRAVSQPTKRGASKAGGSVKLGAKRRKSSGTSASSNSQQQSLNAFTTVSPRFVRITTAAAAASMVDDDDVVCTGMSQSAEPPRSTPSFPSSSLDASVSTRPASSSLLIPPHTFPRMKLVEVKGPNDRLSSQQSAWLQVLSPFMSVEVCYVLLPDQANK